MSGLLITVKYHGPTNHRGSKWSATMASPSDGGRDSLRVYEPFQYGAEDGSKMAAEKAIAKWESLTGLDREKYPGSWSVELVGVTHNHLHIFKPTWAYDKEGEL